MESKIKITVNYDLADPGSKDYSSIVVVQEKDGIQTDLVSRAMNTAAKEEKEFFEDLVSKMCFLFNVAPIKKPRYFPNGIRIHKGSFENENRN